VSSGGSSARACAARVCEEEGRGRRERLVRRDGGRAVGGAAVCGAVCAGAGVCRKWRLLTEALAVGVGVIGIVGGAQARNEVLAVETRVVGEDGGDGAQRTREGLDGQGALACRARREAVDGARHQHLAAARP